MMSYIKSSSNVGKSCFANNEGNFIIQNNYVSFLTERAIILLITGIQNLSRQNVDCFSFLFVKILWQLHEIRGTERLFIDKFDHDVQQPLP